MDVALAGNLDSLSGCRPGVHCGQCVVTARTARGVSAHGRSGPHAHIAFGIFFGRKARVIDAAGRYHPHTAARECDQALVAELERNQFGARRQLVRVF